jgi:hydrogenase maturation protein HypF
VTVVTEGDRVRRAVRVSGVVQGVGYRPFVYRLATTAGLAGLVGNDAEGVFVEIEGPFPAVECFVAALRATAPPLARVDGVESIPVPVQDSRGFTIVESRGSAKVATTVPPDTALCDDCRRELFDPTDRRYRYPFITCTNCGPRFTISTALPYDRPTTTMAGFDLCPDCHAEYEDPTDRRFHAQPLACAACGPQLWLERPDGRNFRASDAALAATHRLLADGAIVAVKGLGGYHLACDASSDDAVALLRVRKHRPDKPFAVMVRDLTAAMALAEIGDDEAALLASPAAPIVLLRARPDHGLAAGVAPGTPWLGLLLPYTPVHHLLFAPVPGRDTAVPDALVMTSGNVSDEPICFDDDDARSRLGKIADAFLVHDRPIHVPCDDSVVRVVDHQVLPIRRSRGHTPIPVRLPVDVSPALAVGGELKNTFCLARHRDAWLSQHIGDMGTVETLAAFERSVGQFRSLFGVTPVVVAADGHPAYHSTRWAEEQAGLGPVSPVQHHHAHLAALLAEHGEPLDATVVGVVFDGTGYGVDGTIWGGEILLGGYRSVSRVGYLQPFPLPGGDATIRRPYRVALALLAAAGVDWEGDLPPVMAAPPAELEGLRRQLRRGSHCVATSSMGRLFDAVASLIGVRHVVTYEAQAAMELEELAVQGAGHPVTYRFAVDQGVIDPAPVVVAMVGDLRRGVPAAAIAAGFHDAVAEAVAGLAGVVAAGAGTRDVGLTGGVFQNAVLTTGLRRRLHERGLRVLTHSLVPPNDGGLALGQMAVLAARLHRGRNNGMQEVS